MKKILIALSLAGLSVLGVATASAQYYGTSYGTSYSGSYMMYPSSYSYPSNMMNQYGYGTSYSYPSYSSSYYPYYGNTGGVGSYTIGCTTYYYNTRTGATISTQNICNNYNYGYNNSYYNNYSYPVSYTYPTSYTYPSYSYSTPYYYGNTSYCTYSYMNGIWYPTCNGGYNNGYNYNYGSSCHYYQNGGYMCY